MVAVLIRPKRAILRHPLTGAGRLADGRCLPVLLRRQGEHAEEAAATGRRRQDGNRDGGGDVVATGGTGTAQMIVRVDFPGLTAGPLLSPGARLTGYRLNYDQPN